jgi:hypothetical protein
VCCCDGDCAVSPADYKGDVIDPSKEGDNGLTTHGGQHYHTITLKDGTVIKTVMPADIVKEKSVEDNKEGAGLSGGVNGNPPNKPDSCVNFKRYVYEVGGDNPGKPSDPEQVESLPIPASTCSGGDDKGPGSTIVHENWCSLFDTACTSAGGIADNPDCLRMVLDRSTKEAVSTYYEKLEENRKNVGISKAMSSLNKLLEEVSTKIK